LFGFLLNTDFERCGFIGKAALVTLKIKTKIEEYDKAKRDLLG
jgi:hypothetical protein